MSARPWWKFYISNWRGDAKLNLCSARARGVWFEMLLVMVEADPAGHLVLPDGSPMSAEVLAEQASLKLAEVQSGITELERNRVFDRLDTGIIVSRKMVRDARRSEEQRARVSKRWGSEKTAENAPGNTGSIPNGPKTEDRGQKKKKKPKTDVLGSAPTKTPKVKAPPSKPSYVTAPNPEESAFEAYNAVAAELGLLEAKVLTPWRRRKLHSMLRTHGMMGWTQALERLAQSPFATGAGPSGWRMDLADLLDPVKFNRLIDGGYSERRKVNGQHPEPTRAQRAGDARRENLQRAFNAVGGGPGPAGGGGD